MREVTVAEITAAIERLFIDANFELAEAVTERLECAAEDEASSTGRAVLRELIENARIARDERVPMCQDTGLAVVFVEIGQDVHLTGGSLSAAVAEGVRRAYRNGFFEEVLLRSLYEREYGGQYAACHTRVPCLRREDKNRGNAEGRRERELQRSEDACAVARHDRGKGLRGRRGEEGRAQPLPAYHSRGRRGG